MLMSSRLRKRFYAWLEIILIGKRRLVKKRAGMKHLVNHPPASGTGKAIGYLLGNWQRLKVCMDDGEVEIDNNNIENAIRPLALGRKNWMFAGSENGAKWASTAYTIIATAKLHNLDPKKYIELLLEKLPAMKSSEIDSLLPWVSVQ